MNAKNKQPRKRVACEIVKQYTFRSGETITLCSDPECAKHNAARREILAPEGSTAASVRPSYNYALDVTPEISANATDFYRSINDALPLEDSEQQEQDDQGEAA